MSRTPPIPDAVKERIRELRAQGLTLAVIADRLGLSHETVRRTLGKLERTRAQRDNYHRRREEALQGVPAIPDDVVNTMHHGGSPNDEQEAIADKAIEAATEAIQAGWTALEHERHGNRHYMVTVTKVAMIGGGRRNDRHKRE